MNRIAFLLLTLLLLTHLGPAAASWAPVAGNIMTRWAATVDPNNVLPEYPRPIMTRPDWQNLNGLWEFQAAGADDKPPTGQTLSEQILVPFAVESALSGLKKHVDRAWYRRSFTIPAGWAGKDVLLHFGAVDFETTVIVNGKQVGSHRGGFDPFTIDITSALTASGPQELIVNVYDPTDSGEQPRGKQVLNPNGIWYTPITGIWQTVWLEPVPQTRIASFHAVPSLAAGALKLTVDVPHADKSYTVQAVAMNGATVVGQATGAAGTEFSIPVPNAKLWTPDSPFLYDLKITLLKDGQTVDSVGSYFGMREITMGKDAAGITRPLLNGKFVFQEGPLDQGFWPDGLYTAPTDDALKYDLEMTKQFGFNMTRKHIKIEPDRWYYWCDKLGLLVWQDMPSGNNNGQEAHIEFEHELRQMIPALWNHPSIVMWVVFNEGWGQFDTARLTNLTKKLDPSRLANNATGWTDAGAGDVVDWHVYPGPGSPTPEAKRAAVLGEFGGLGLVEQGHLWNADSWSYSGYASSDDLLLAYEGLMRGVYALRDAPGLSATVYTQITDVETEENGLMTYDRAINKMDPAAVAKLTQGQFPPAPVYVLPTSESSGVSWKYTTTQPATSWSDAAFDDGAWSQGPGGFGTAGTPGAVVRTTWSTADIWIRTSFQLDQVPAGTPMLRVHHDEDCEIYINGVLASTLTGYVGAYGLHPVSAAATATVKAGRNVIAIHCHQTTGGQYIDAGLGYR